MQLEELRQLKISNDLIMNRIATFRLVASTNYATASPFVQHINRELPKAAGQNNSTNLHVVLY
jgi:hypothetical protein